MNNCVYNKSRAVEDKLNARHRDDCSPHRPSEAISLQLNRLTSELKLFSPRNALDLFAATNCITIFVYSLCLFLLRCDRPMRWKPKQLRRCLKAAARFDGDEQCARNALGAFASILSAAPILVVCFSLSRSPPVAGGRASEQYEGRIGGRAI